MTDANFDEDLIRIRNLDSLFAPIAINKDLGPWHINLRLDLRQLVLLNVLYDLRIIYSVCQRRL